MRSICGALAWIVLTLNAAGEPIEVVSLKKIWDRAAHNAFTDLIRFQNRWYCTFRESDLHAAGQNGKLRIIVSADGETWSSASLIEERGIDLRDPKLSVMPDGRMMLVAGGSVYEGPKYLTRRPRVAFSKDGREWTPMKPILAEDHWLWRITWHKGVAYGLSKMGAGREPRRGFLYRSTDGLDWQWITAFEVPGVSETTLRFGADDEMIALVRREAENRRAWVGTSRPPYKDWQWRETAQRIGGPDFTTLPDGRFIAAMRLYEDESRQGERRTSVCWLDPYQGTLIEALTLPSAGDNSYPGIVWHDALLWISYYSAHEGTSRENSAIYLAKVRLPRK
jgi:hypothetical protein